MNVKQPEISYPAPGHESWYNHFGKVPGVIYKSRADTPCDHRLLPISQ